MGHLGRKNGVGILNHDANVDINKKRGGEVFVYFAPLDSRITRLEPDPKNVVLKTKYQFY